MPLDAKMSLIVIFAAGITVFFTRVLAFLFFSDINKMPHTVLYLGQVLPFSVMGLLVIYCLRNVSFLTGTHGLPEFISVGFVVLLHLWKRNSVLSMAGGTILYMVLVQKVFIY